MNRTVAILILIGAMGLLVASFLAVGYPVIHNQVQKLAVKLPHLHVRVQHEFLPYLKSKFHFELPPSFSAALSSYGDQLKEAAPAILKKVGGLAGGLVATTGLLVHSVLNLAMIPLFTFYFLRDFDKMVDSASTFIPTFRREHISKRLREMDQIIGAWFRAQVQIAFLLGLLYAIGLAIVFGVYGQGMESGFAIGLMAGILNIIPYFGFAIGFTTSILITLIDWHGLGPIVGVLAVFAVVHTLEGYIITPKLMGDKVGLSPVTVIVVLLIGGEVAGLLGILLAIPVAGAIKVLLPDFAHMYRRSTYFTGHVILPHQDAPAGFGPDEMDVEPDPIPYSGEDTPSEIYTGEATLKETVPASVSDSVREFREQLEKEEQAAQDAKELPAGEQPEKVSDSQAKEPPAPPSEPSATSSKPTPKDGD
jgi:predicted PurR-regulated permease PerM